MANEREQSDGNEDQPLWTPYVFVDTQAFYSERFDWDGRVLSRFADLVKQGRIRLLTTTITVQEIQSQFPDVIQNAIVAAEKHKGVWRLFDAVLIERLTSSDARDKLEARFAKYFKEANVIEVPLTVPIDRLMADYFASRPPFSDKKKAEFPDAMVVSSLRSWCETQNAFVYVVSGDLDMKACCSENGPLLHAKSLNEIISRVILPEKVHEALLNAFRRSEALAAGVKEHIRRHFFIEVEPFAEYAHGRVMTAGLRNIKRVEFNEVYGFGEMGGQFNCQVVLTSDLELELDIDVGGDSDLTRTVVARQRSTGSVTVTFDYRKPDEMKVESIDLGEYGLSLEYVLRYCLLPEAS